MHQFSSSRSCCRRLSASTFNASIDVRKEQPRFALGLLLASASCCVVMATRCDLDGGNDALQQLVHDSIKRCMLGFNTAAEVRDKEHFLVTGLQILCTVCAYAEVREYLLLLYACQDIL